MKITYNLNDLLHMQLIIYSTELALIMTDIITYPKDF